MVSSAKAYWGNEWEEECVRVPRSGGSAGIIGHNDIDDSYGCYKQLDNTGICYVVTYIRENVAHMYNNNNGIVNSSSISSRRSGGSFEEECDPYFLCEPRYAAGSERADEATEKYETFDSVADWHAHKSELVSYGWLINPAKNNAMNAAAAERSGCQE